MFFPTAIAIAIGILRCNGEKISTTSINDDTTSMNQLDRFFQCLSLAFHRRAAVSGIDQILAIGFRCRRKFIIIINIHDHERFQIARERLIVPFAANRRKSKMFLFHSDRVSGCQDNRRNPDIYRLDNNRYS